MPLKRKLAESAESTPKRPRREGEEGALCRSRTESSVMSSSSSSSSSKSLDRTLSLPNLPSSNTKTYAGRYRSFLMAIPDDARESYSSLRSRWGVDISEDDPHQTPSPTKSTISEASPKPSLPLKTIAELRNKGESRRFLDELGYLFEGLDPKSTISLRRSSALEITTKLCDPEFTQKAKAADFFTRTWELFLVAGAGKGEDKILDILLVFFLALVARDDPSSLSELPSSLVDTLNRISLKQETDLLVLASNSSKIPKRDRAILSSILKIITSKSHLFPPSTPITTPLLITFVLQALHPTLLSSSPHLLETVLSSLRQCLSPTTSNSLYANLINSHLDGTIHYECVYYHLKLVDSYLVGSWAGEGGEAVEEYLNKAREEWMVRELLSLGICCEVTKLRSLAGSSKSLTFTADDDDDDGEGEETEEEEEATNHNQQEKCYTLTLRILISLTHTDEQWARSVLLLEESLVIGLVMRGVWRAGRELALVRGKGRGGLGRLSKKGQEEEEESGDEEEQEQEGTHALDTLCLLLGLLTNLVQVVDEAKDVVRQTRVNPSCQLGTPACLNNLKKCPCPSSSSSSSESKTMTGIEVLVWLYEQQQRGREDDDDDNDNDEEQEAQSSFLLSHLSVLFGLLMMGSLENQSAILGFEQQRSGSGSSSSSTTVPLSHSRRRRRDHNSPSHSSSSTTTTTNTVSATPTTTANLKKVFDVGRPHKGPPPPPPPPPPRRRLGRTRTRTIVITPTELADQARAFGLFYDGVVGSLGGGGGLGRLRRNRNWDKGRKREEEEEKEESEHEGEGEKGSGGGGGGGGVAERDEREKERASRVVQDVVRFLEGLKDTAASQVPVPVNIG